MMRLTDGFCSLRFQLSSYVGFAFIINDCITTYAIIMSVNCFADWSFILIPFVHRVEVLSLLKMEDSISRRKKEQKDPEKERRKLQSSLQHVAAIIDAKKRRLTGKRRLCQVLFPIFTLFRWRWRWVRWWWRWV